MGEGIPGGMLTPTANGSEAADDLHVAPRPHNSAPSHLRRDDSPVGALSNMHHEEGRATGVWGAVREYLPRGNTLDPDVFHRRHLLLCWILGLHIPALFAFGVWQGFGVEHSALEMGTPAACLLFARLARNRRLAAFFVTAGLVFCSSVLVHFSNGTIEAHFHFFILIGLIALYQDWVPFLWNVIFTVISHGLGSSIAADLMFNHSAAQNRPWSWAAIHGVSVLAACVGVIIFWKNTELEQHRNTSLAAELARAELTAVQSEAAQRQTMSELLVNLARRNQSLLDRQLEVISDLEQRERQPEALSELFKLDHLATRIRRNAESLLVLAGDDPPRRWGRPVALAEVVRAAAAEVEDYGRVEVLVNDHLEVAGRAVADLAHLLAELIENATVFSPPNVGVRVRSYLALGDGPRFVISIEDNGIGMSEEELRAANLVLSERPEVDLRRTRLGFHVVGRLAQRYGLHVHLATTPGGGVTALVSLPEDVVSEQRVPAMAGVGAAPFGTVGFAPPPAPSSSPGVPASVPVAPRSSAGLPALPPPPPPPPPSYAPPSFAPPPPPPPPPPATDPWPPMPVPRATIATELPFLPAEAPPPPPPPPPAARVEAVPASPEDAPAPAPGPTPAGPQPGSSSTAPAPPTAPADSAPPAPMDVAAPAATRPAGPDPTEDPASSPVVPPGTGWPASNADPAPPPEPGWPAPGADWTWPAAIPADSAPPVPAGFPPSSPAVPADPSSAAAAPPAALSVEEAALLAAVPHEALPNGEVVSPERPEPAQTSGLARRVPGRALAEPLRRAGDPDGSDRVAPVVLDDSDRARMRTMLSRFQAGQEAGRAAVEQPTETGDPATAPPDPPPPEDDP